MTTQQKNAATIAADAAKARKRAEALRQNLARRKEQARDRMDNDTESKDR